MLTLRRLVGTILAPATTALLVLAITHRSQANKPHTSLAVLSQTYIALKPAAVLRFPPLVTATGQTFTTAQLHGHWSLIFFGFTSCALVCPKTLSLLTAVAHNPESGVSSGNTQLVFVSVDPERDTTEKLADYLRHFDSHIIGLTGSRSAVQIFSTGIGAGSQAVGSSIDHSTSIFVVDPKGRLAGILLRPNIPSRILADLAELRRSDKGGSAQP